MLFSPDKMNAKALAAILFFIINFKSCQGINYTNYFLITVYPATKDQIAYLHTLETEKYMDVIFCEKASKTGHPVQVIVSPTDVAMFRERAEHFNLEYRVLMHDIQRAFNYQTLISYKTLRPDTYSFEHFHVLEDIYQWLTDMNQNKSYPVIHMTIGRSIEGRDISMVNINIDPGPRKEKVIIEGGIHGHEWASVVFVTYLINELAESQSSNDYAWKKLARTYDWYLIPVVNPDGYDYTHKKDRLWRKNRNMGENSFGVDLNRNFEESFGKFGSSSDPISDNYCGPKPFSEPESKALSFFIATNHKELKYYFAIHAYGQRIIIPYEDRIQHVENFGEMESYSRQAVRKLYLRSHVKYTTGTAYDTIGARISGTSTSWAKKQMRTKYVYTIQLRDNGTYGFALPCIQLLPMCHESKLIVTELMTAKPRYVRALYDDDASINAPDLLFMLLGVFITLK